MVNFQPLLRTAKLAYRPPWGEGGVRIRTMCILKSSMSGRYWATIVDARERSCNGRTEQRSFCTNGQERNTPYLKIESALAIYICYLSCATLHLWMLKVAFGGIKASKKPLQRSILSDKTTQNTVRNEGTTGVVGALLLTPSGLSTNLLEFWYTNLSSMNSSRRETATSRWCGPKNRRRLSCR